MAQLIAELERINNELVKSRENEIKLSAQLTNFEEQITILTEYNRKLQN